MWIKGELDFILQSFKTLRFWKTIFLMFIGIFIFASAVNGLLIPHQFFAASITGLSMIFYYLLGWPSLGVIYILLNIPIFILGGKEMSLKYLLISFIGVIFSWISFEVTQGYVIPTKDNIMTAILAGVMTGAGAGLYLRVGGSAGGMDIIATVIKKKLAIPMGTTFMLANIVNITAAVFITDIDTALYTGIYMFVNSWMMEKVQTGFSQRKAVFIITHCPDLVAEKVIKQLDRGVTFFHASGGFSHQETRVVYTVINMVELGQLKELLFHVDPDAFIAVNNTAEVIGNKFLSWEDVGFTPNRKTGKS